MLHEETLTQTVLRPTYLTIDLDTITHNFKVITKRATGSKVMFVLKANAYGHGLIRIAQHLERLGAMYFGVAYLEEGLMLREAGIQTPILVLGGIIGNQIPLFIQNDLTITASSVEKLIQIDKTAQALGAKAKAHIKVDTGMERIGTHYYSAEHLLETSLDCKHTIIEGIFSHFSNADSADLSYTSLQLERFNQVLDFYKSRKLELPMTHISNSGGLLQIDNVQFEMVRVGILLFGIFPSLELKDQLNVKPALSWKSNVVYFKVVKPGHPVSYGGTWQANKNTRVITLPVGYGDGYMRAMSNKASVIVRGKKYPVVGSICMDQTMVDVGDGTAYNNDEVILIGKQGDQEITVEDLAGWANTIPYEILTNINTRVPRVYASVQQD